MKKLISFGSAFALTITSALTFASRAYAISLCPTLSNTNSNILCTANINNTLPGVINILLFVAFVAALVFLIYGGIRWIISGGDKEGTAKAKGTVTAALIGLAIVLGSWILVNIVLGLFGITATGDLQLPSLFGVTN